MDARAKITAWRDEDNGERPHSSLGYRMPNEFAETLKSSVILLAEGSLSFLSVDVFEWVLSCSDRSARFLRGFWRSYISPAELLKFSSSERAHPVNLPEIP